MANYTSAPKMHGIWTTKAFGEELKHLQKQQIIVQLDVDETAEWYNSFVLVPKSNGRVRLCLDPAGLNQALTRPVHRGPTLNDIFPNLNNTKYLCNLTIFSKMGTIIFAVRQAFARFYHGFFQV